MFLMKRHPRDKQSGDTIVEVMIVLAVLGLAIGISYATANSSLRSARQAQENSQATELVQSQLEQLRTQASNADTSSPNYIYRTDSQFCMSNGAVVLEPDIATGTYPAACVSSYYHLSISYTTTDDTFTATATWDNVFGQGKDTVANSYRLHLTLSGSPVTTSCPTGYEGTPPDCIQIPFLAVSGCTGPTGAGWTGNSCLPDDTVSVTVSGASSASGCVLKNDQGDNSGTTIPAALRLRGNTCSGHFTFSALNLSIGQTGYLTAYVTDSATSTVYASNSLSLTASLSLSVSGGSAGDGGFYPNDTVTISVEGATTGDTCAIQGPPVRRGVPTTYLSSCSGTFSAENLPANTTTPLTAYVTDSDTGKQYTSNTVNVKTELASCPYFAQQSTKYQWEQYEDSYTWMYGDLPPYCVPWSF